MRAAAVYRFDSSARAIHDTHVYTDVCTDVAATHRFDGVPEKPSRRLKSIVPPRSWPDADSFFCWNSIVSGKMWSLT